jgi:hypothetical protein
LPGLLLGFSSVVSVLDITPRARQTLSESLSSGQGIRDFNSVIERVRAEPGDVLTGRRLDAVVRAGKRVMLEPYIQTIYYYNGQWNPDEFTRRICAGDFRLVVLTHDLYDPPIVIAGYPEWPEPVLNSLRSVMHLEQKVGIWFLYVPRHLGAGETCP